MDHRPNEIGLRAELEVATAFGIYSPHLDRVYLVPIDGFSERGCHLRLGPTRNGQQKGVRFAADYEVRPLARRAVGEEGEQIPGR